jgi:SAM-dependent methyltransferase/uncharacterized protein YbaR (Trm112 family)
MLSEITILEPGTKTRLKVFNNSEGKALFYYSDFSKTIYPIKEDIPIVLPPQSRNPHIELPLLNEIITNKELKNNVKIIEMFENTISIIKSVKQKSWEWEDEEFWSTTYNNNLKSKIKKNWNDRIWQRKTLINKLPLGLFDTKINILDIGCGEGQNFRELFRKKISNESIYVATDISFNALILNRQKNNFVNSLYILCSADYLPFEDNIFDVILLFGILHHTHSKEKILSSVNNIFKQKGYCLVHEAIVHNEDELSNHLKNIKKSVKSGNDSYHEERIILKNLLLEIEYNNYSFIFKRQENSYYFFRLFNLIRNLLLKYEFLFRFLSFIDRVIIKVFNGKIKKFNSNEILLLLQK